MAVFFNLSIDCDQNESVAIALTERFSRLVIKTDRFGLLNCQAEHTLPTMFWGNHGVPPKSDAGDWHKVCVHPTGMSMPTKQPGILNHPNMNFVRDQLYQVLRGTEEPVSFPGFRSAYFGWEAQDILGDTEWLEQIAEINRVGKLPDSMQGLILREDIITNPDAKTQLVEFSPGYVWWNEPIAGYGPKSD